MPMQLSAPPKQSLVIEAHAPLRLPLVVRDDVWRSLKHALDESGCEA